MNTTYAAVMGIDRDTLAETDRQSADYFTVALVTLGEDDQYVSHQCVPGEYASYEGAVSAARTACTDYGVRDMLKDSL